MILRNIAILYLFGTIALGCAGSHLQEKDIKEFQDERANPYTFNRSVAYTLLRTNQPMEASRVIRRMLEMKPDSPEALTMLGRAYLDLREYELAERALKGALAEDSEFPQAHALLGVLLDTRGQHMEARTYHKRSIKLDPKSPAFRNNLGFSFYLDGRYDQAIKSYTAALARDLGDHRVHNNLGFAYAKADNLEKAEKHFQLAGPPAQASNNLGYVHETRGDDERAYEYYYLAVVQDPMLQPARTNLKRVCERLGLPVPDVPVPEVTTEPLPPPEPALSQEGESNSTQVVEEGP